MDEEQETKGSGVSVVQKNEKQWVEREEGETVRLRTKVGWRDD